MHKHMEKAHGMAHGEQGSHVSQDQPKDPSSGHGKVRSPATGSQVLSASYGAFCKRNSMLSSARHPLALLRGGSIESTATFNGFHSVRQASQDLEPPLVRRPKPTLETNRTKQQFPTKAAAWKAVAELGLKPRTPKNGNTVRSVIAKYEIERMPARHSTGRVYRSFLNNHIRPQWGDTLIQDIQPRPVELWLRELPLSPKSKTHVRSLIHGLVEFAMWSGILETNRNPISLVRNKGAMKKVRISRSLTKDQFHS